jgi:hypothetical protein
LGSRAPASDREIEGQISDVFQPLPGNHHLEELDAIGGADILDGVEEFGQCKMVDSRSRRFPCRAMRFGWVWRIGSLSGRPSHSPLESRMPLKGNMLFRGRGRGLPGGGGEINVAPINTAGSAGIRQVTVDVKD